MRLDQILEMRLRSLGVQSKSENSTVQILQVQILSKFSQTDQTFFQPNSVLFGDAYSAKMIRVASKPSSSSRALVRARTQRRPLSIADVLIWLLRLAHRNNFKFLLLFSSLCTFLQLFGIFAGLFFKFLQELHFIEQLYLPRFRQVISLSRALLFLDLAEIHAVRGLKLPLPSRSQLHLLARITIGGASLVRGKICFIDAVVSIVVLVC